ncbi:MAG TPA: GtrA family protein [Beijerinckiaceae bacterium]
MSRFLRFALVGAAGFLVDAGTLMLLLAATPAGLYAGRLGSFLAAVTFTWAANRRYTFGAGRRSARGLVAEWSRFVAVNALGGGVNLGVYTLLVSTSALFAARPWLAVAVGSVAGLAVNFAGSSRLVFRDPAASTAQNRLS